MKFETAYNFRNPIIQKGKEFQTIQFKLSRTFNEKELLLLWDWIVALQIPTILIYFVETD